MVNRSIDKTPFEIVHTYSPCYICDLAVMPTVAAVGENKAADNAAEKVLKIIANVQAHLEATNAKYKAEADKHHARKCFRNVIW